MSALVVLGLAASGVASFASRTRDARRAGELRSAYATLRFAAATERKALAEALRRRHVDGRALVAVSSRAVDALRDGRANADGADRVRLARLGSLHAQALSADARVGAALAAGERSRALRLAGAADALLARLASAADAGVGDARLRDAGRWPRSTLDVLQFVAMACVFLVGLVAALEPLFRVTGYRRRADAARQEELRRLQLAALTDSLTGLRNHRAFHEDLTRELNRRNRTGTSFSLLMIDLDGLKGINDSLGHQAGDERIRAVADSLRETVRGSDTAYRIGGDEFAVVVPGERAWGALNLANRLHSEVARQNGFVRVTVGVAESVGTEAKDTLIRHADVALYEAKRSRLGTVVYSPGLERGEVRPEAQATAEHHKLLAGALARSVDAKSAGTRNHCETVGELCGLIGRGLALAPARVEKLRIAGLLHDVGKIGIADTILLEPAAPGAEEEAAARVVRSHSAIGLDIVAAAGLDEEAAWVLHHDEWFDGSGYPDGLAGQEIPLESRIILVAEAFEALTGSRAYGPARPPVEALEELVAHAGTRFDPACVAALCEALGHVPTRPLRRDDELARRRRRHGEDGRSRSTAAGA